MSNLLEETARLRAALRVLGQEVVEGINDFVDAIRNPFNIESSLPVLERARALGTPADNIVNFIHNYPLHGELTKDSFRNLHLMLRDDVGAGEEYHDAWHQEFRAPEAAAALRCNPYDLMTTCGETPGGVEFLRAVVEFGKRGPTYLGVYPFVVYTVWGFDVVLNEIDGIPGAYIEMINMPLLVGRMIHEREYGQ